jgi:3-isopropylmalate/(R)-2-methylmalate dehydratase small subunit
MTPFTRIESRAVLLAVDNIDTDQIIPARFLKVTDKASVAEGLFTDWRYNEDGTPKPDFILNQPQYQGAQVLLAGDNFGCGSSREHAPWALVGWGIRAVISTSFADIFKNNSLKNGLLPITVNAAAHRKLFEVTKTAPDTPLKVDLASQTISLPDGWSYNFQIDGFAKKCMLEGVDQLGYILSFEEKIIAYENNEAIIIA